MAALATTERLLIVTGSIVVCLVLVNLDRCWELMEGEVTTDVKIPFVAVYWVLALETSEGSGWIGAQRMSVPRGTVDPHGTDGVASVQTRQGKQAMHSPVVAFTIRIDWFSLQSSSKHCELTLRKNCQIMIRKYKQG